MGNSQTKHQSSNSGNHHAELEEPQIFLQKKLTPYNFIKVIWAKHMKLDFDMAVFPINNEIFEIEALNRYWLKGVKAKSIEGNMDLDAWVLDRGVAYANLEKGEFIVREFKHTDDREGRFFVALVNYPKYAGREEDTEKLRVCFENILKKGIELDAKKIAIQLSQASIMSYPKPIFCQEVVKTSKKCQNELIETATPDLNKPLDIILQCYDHASIRLACKYMLKNLSDCESADDLNSNVSSIDFLPDEIDEVTKKMRFRGYGVDCTEDENDEEEEVMGLV